MFEAGFAERFIAVRAFNGPSADRHQDARRAAVIVLAPALAIAARTVFLEIPIIRAITLIGMFSARCSLPSPPL